MTLAPEPRRRCRLAIRRLETGAGDIKSLEGRLTGYSRLRVGAYRFVFISRIKSGRLLCDVLFAEHRSLVYELWSAMVRTLSS